MMYFFSLSSELGPFHMRKAFLLPFGMPELPVSPLLELTVTDYLKPHHSLTAVVGFLLVTLWGPPPSSQINIWRLILISGCLALAWLVCSQLC